MDEYHTLCRADEIPPGGARVCVVGDRMIGVFHIDGEFFAIENACPHAGASLAHGEISGHTVACRIHYWRFCVRSGEYLDEARPAMNVKTYPLRIVDGNVQVHLPPTTDSQTTDSQTTDSQTTEEPPTDSPGW